MKTTCRSDIHCRIGVMHPMKAPQKWNAVIHAMPGIHPEVQQDEGAQQMCPRWHRHPMEESKLLLFGPMRDREPKCNTQHTVKNGVDCTQRQVPHGVACPLPWGAHK